MTDEAGVGCGLWSLGAAFFDYDNDGDLDLFVANYFKFDPANAPFDRDDPARAANTACRTAYGGQPDSLYRNDGDGKFTDVTPRPASPARAEAWACLAADFDGDGHMDILVANDAEANALWRNKGDGTFEESPPPGAWRTTAEGNPEANMGIA